MSDNSYNGENASDELGIDVPINICLIGPSKSGKTALRIRWDGKPFPKEYKPTTDTNTYNRISHMGADGRQRDIDVWDTPGSRKLVDVEELKAVLEKCDGVMLVFNLTKESTLHKMETYWNYVMDVNPTAVILLLGSKSDDAANREVDFKEAKELSDKLCCEKFFEVSAKTQSGIKQAMDLMLMSCIEARQCESQKAGPRKNILSVSRSEDNGFLSPKVVKMLNNRELKHQQSSAVDIEQWYNDAEDRDTFLQSFRQKLRKGETVLLYPHDGGQPDYAKLTLNKSNKRLSWESVSSSNTVLDGVVINDIAEIRPHTELSYTFRKMKIPHNCEGTNHLFTIVSSMNSISMAADTPQNCVYLVKGLKLMVEKAVPAHIKRIRGKEPISDAKLMILKRGKRRIESFDDLKRKLCAGIDVIGITPGYNQRELFMYLDSSEKRLIFSRRSKENLMAKSSVFDSLYLYFKGPDPGVDLDDISEVRPGLSPDSMDCKPPPHQGQESLAMSFIASERTMSFLMPSTRERDSLVEKMQAMVRFIRPCTSVY